VAARCHLILWQRYVIFYGSAMSYFMAALCHILWQRYVIFNFLCDFTSYNLSFLLFAKLFICSAIFFLRSFFSKDLTRLSIKRPHSTLDSEELFFKRPHSTLDSEKLFFKRPHSTLDQETSLDSRFRGTFFQETSLDSQFSAERFQKDHSHSAKVLGKVTQFFVSAEPNGHRPKFICA